MSTQTSNERAFYFDEADQFSCIWFFLRMHSVSNFLDLKAPAQLYLTKGSCGALEKNRSSLKLSRKKKTSITDFTGSSGFGSRISLDDEGQGGGCGDFRLRKLGGGFGALLRHTNTTLQKFTKHQNSSCNIVMQYTCWHDRDNNVKFQEFSCPVWQWRGPVQIRWWRWTSYLSREGDTQILNPSALRQEHRGGPSARIQD